MQRYVQVSVLRRVGIFGRCSVTRLGFRHRTGGANETTKVIMNQQITQDPLRVSFVNEAGEKKNDIMSRKDALSFAKRLKLDLILGII